MPVSQKRLLIEPTNPNISIRKQCALLQLNRSDYYYQTQPEVSEEDRWLMDKIDQIYTDKPFYGRIKISKELNRMGITVNHKRVYRLMKLMGIEALVPKKSWNLSKANPNHQVYPYLLKNLIIKKPNQVWGVDITYIKLNHGWLYLTAIMDWYSRYVLSWQLSDSLVTDFCVETLQMALAINQPQIHNSDQGSQFTSQAYVNILKQYPNIQISMDGRGRAFDNIFTERLWRTIKYEEVYLKDYQSPKEARLALQRYIKFYNQERLHQSLNYQTPAEVYFGIVKLQNH